MTSATQGDLPGSSRRRVFATAPALAWEWRRLLPAILVVYACILPRELTITVGNVDFRPYRLALVLVLPIVFQLLATDRKPLSLFDGLAAFVSFWYIGALSVNEPLTAVLATGVGQGADFLLAYAVGRASIRRPDDLVKVSLVVLPGFVAEGVILALESVVVQEHLVRPLLARISGHYGMIIQREFRWGMLRALGTFPHPILSGTFVATIFPFAVLVMHKFRDRALGIFAAFSCIFTVSSTSMLNLIVSFGLIALLVAQRITRWPLLWIAGFYSALLLLAVAAISQGGLMSFIIRYASVNSATGYYRKFIWYYAGAEANAHPWFGIGLRDWVRPAWMLSDTIDASWLLMTMRYGYPASMAFLVLAIGTCLCLALKSGRLRLRTERNACACIAIVIFSLLVSGMSVYLWEGLWVWMVLLIGMGVSVIDYARSSIAECRRTGRRPRLGEWARRPGR